MATAESGFFKDGKKTPWTVVEDEVLRRQVRVHGRHNWKLICQSLLGRSPKSCRLRWCQHLAPELNCQPFMPEEDARVIELHRVHGNKWATIARYLPGRTDNAVKNRWHSALRKRVAGEDAVRDETPATCLELFPLRSGSVKEEAAAAESALPFCEEEASGGGDEVTGLMLTLGLPRQGDLDLALSIGPV